MEIESRMPPAEKLGRILEVMRTALGFKQKGLAEAASIHPSSISQYESGQTVPELATLQKILDAYGLTFKALDLTDRYLLELEAQRRTAAAAAPSETGPVPPEAAALIAEYQRQAESLNAAFVSRLTEVLSATCRPLEAQGVTEEASDSGRIEELWRELKPLSFAQRRKLLLEEERFLSPGLCERLCRESAQMASRHPDHAAVLADLAVGLADRLGRELGSCEPLCAYALAHRANAERARGQLPRAEEAFQQADRLYGEAVRKGEMPPVYEARILDLKSSLRRGQRNLPEALALIDRALAIHEGGPERGRLLIQKSKIVEETGDLGGAITLLREAEPYVDSKADPRLGLCVWHNLADYLSKLGRFVEAAELLPRVRTLSRKLNNELDLVRLRWVEGRVEIGLGETARGLAKLIEVRGEFASRDMDFDTALVTLELAALYAEQGRPAEVKALARHLVPIFQAQRVSREALAALALFRQAAEKEHVTAEWARRMLEYLNRVRHEPGLVFEPGAGA